MNKKKPSRSMHLVGTHLSFSSLVFALKRVEYLNDLNHQASLVEIKNESKSELNLFFRFLKIWKSKKRMKENFENGCNLLHVYSLTDLLILLFLRPFTPNAAICLTLNDLKINKLMELVLKWLIRRVDHIFVSSRFVTDQVWSMFDIPPSRCTVLAITKYLERKDIKLVKMKQVERKKREIKVGCFIGATQEIGAFVRFKRLIKTKCQSDDITYNFFLMRNSINNEFIPLETNQGKLQTTVIEDIDPIDLDFWLVFSNTDPCPYINDALKIGARVVAPSTHYTSELQRILGQKMITYKAGEVSSAVRMLLSLAPSVISGCYGQEGLSGSSWVQERKYLVDGYEKAIRRRKYLSRITS